MQGNSVGNRPKCTFSLLGTLRVADVRYTERAVLETGHWHGGTVKRRCPVLRVLGKLEPGANLDESVFDKLVVWGRRILPVSGQ